MLYRELAPITNEAWAEIDERAKEVLKIFLSARKVVKVEGPKGFHHNVITEGRLTNIVDEDDLCYGNYQVIPLMESRIEFEMERWELDNIIRGAKDIDYEPLEKAMEKIALFEENAIYNGLEDASIKGLKNSVESDEIIFGKTPTEIMEAITEGVIRLKEAYVEKPYALVVGKEAYKRIISEETAYALDKRIEKLIDGKIVYSHVVDGAYLLPYNHEDLELTIGGDFSIGYVSHTNKKVRFFAAESFTFRVLDPAIIVKYRI